MRAMTALDPSAVAPTGATMSGMADAPYWYLVSYTGHRNGTLVSGHHEVGRFAPLTSGEAFGSVLDFIKKDAELDQKPAITGVFTFANSTDAAVRAR